MNVCPKCNAPITPGSRFCGQCGADLETGVTPKKSSGCLKFFLVGCVVVSILTVIFFFASGYIAKKWAGDLVGSENSYWGKRIKAVNETSAFKPKPDGEIREDQLDRFLKVVEEFASVRNQHESEFDEFQKKMTDSNFPFIEGFQFWRKVGNQLREAFVSGLEKQHMSLDEYRYVHRAVVKAQIASAGAEIQQSPENTGLENVPDAEQREIYDDAKRVPAANLELIRKEKERVDKDLPSAPIARILFPLLTLGDTDFL